MWASFKCYQITRKPVNLAILDTWSGFEAAKTAHDLVGDSTTLVNSLSPQMSELVEDAVAS